MDHMRHMCPEFSWICYLIIFPLTLLRNKRSISIGPYHAMLKIMACSIYIWVLKTTAVQTWGKIFDGPKSYYFCISHHIFLHPFHLSKHHNGAKTSIIVVWPKEFFWTKQPKHHVTPPNDTHCSQWYPCPISKPICKGRHFQDLTES